MSVSLVITTFLNGPDYPQRIRSLHCTLASLECQTYRDWDALIVHNGSTMHEDAGKLIKNCPVINQVNWYFNDQEVGQWGHPLKWIGAMRTTGKYIGFLNDDVYCAPSYLERLVELLEQGADLAYCNYIHGFKEIVDGYEPYMPQVSYPAIGRIGVGGWLAKRWLIKEVPWTDFSEHGDGAYVQALAKESQYTASCSQFLYLCN